MKTLFIGVALLIYATAVAQNYTMDWYKVAGGGGTSSGGSFTVTGTIGQQDAGNIMNGGSFSLMGGFWSLLAEQAEAPPLLGIFPSVTNTVVVYWPSVSEGWHLQQSTDLSVGSWITPGEAVNDDGLHKFIIVNPTAGNRWYRLEAQ